MPRYSLSMESIGHLRKLANDMEQSLKELQYENSCLQNCIGSLMDDLGIYGVEIWEIILKVRDVCNSCFDEVEMLAEKIVNKADEMEEIISSVVVTAPGTCMNDNQSKEFQTVEQISSWIGDINPHYYDLGIPPWQKELYHENCGSCAFAVENRFWGNTDIVATSTNIGTDRGMEIVTGKRCVYMPMDDIETRLKTMGPGSHLIVGINRHPAPNGLPQAGHWFNAYYDGQNVYAVDGQIGKILDWPPDYHDISEWCAMV